MLTFIKKSSTALSWLHWLVLVCSLILTITAWQITLHQTHQKSQVQFDFQVSQLLGLVQDRMSKYEEALTAGVSAIHMFAAPVNRESWKTFASQFDISSHFPGVSGIGVIHYVPQKKVTSYLTWQQQSFPSYDMHPIRIAKDYWPITYIEPEEENRAAVGLDMAHENNRYAAARLARTKGTPQITGPITLVQDSKQTPGFLFYVPWFDKRKVPQYYGDESDGFLGLVYAPFIVQHLMNGTLEDANRLINFSIHDDNISLYDELTNSREALNHQPMFDEQLEVNMYGRRWLFDFQSSPLFEAQQHSNQPTLILMFGLLVNVMLFAILMILRNGEEKAQGYARKLSRDLQERTDSLEKASENLAIRNLALERANRDLDQFAYVASHDLKAPLRGISQLVSWINEDIEEHLTPETKDYSRLLQGRVVRLERLLDDLLSYFRVGRKKNEIQEFSLASNVQETFELLNMNNKATLICDDSIGPFRTLVVPLDLILRNLMSNAIKHHDKAHANIKVSGVYQGDHYKFCVEDDGPGIPTELYDKVFELFHTLQPRDSVEGSGMGLSIIKKTLELYGCHFELHSNSQGGCSFVFTWPTEELLEKKEII
ncbi:CHASE domain-containing protein [Vibrio cyclitrophicus]|uniref:sensor histidine kinase n=1 Tax=Vibrio cyclitrophicus TaxID=47951 RepID=UPI000C8219BD|nr:CHASE domain-containing protein [Vibrio cyclitrophicus]PMJ44418.1 histidine kinase [Vibrio cyclitrophicus]UPR26483.1 CHASE domain-containing protein [Vibrio cyclitrophicus]